jgi:hypothetical protein
MDAVALIEAFVSFLCLFSLIVILLEAERNGGFRRRWPIAVWSASLIGLALFAALRVFENLGDWSDARILLGILGACNFLFGGALLLRWLFWTPPSPGG